MCFNVLTYSIIFVANALIWRKSRTELMSEQQQSRDINRQVGRVLLIQAMFPLAFMLLPTLISVTSVMIGGTQETDLGFVLYFQYWTALINPVATILIVRQYRRAFFKAIYGTRTSSNIVHNVNTIQQQTYVHRVGLTNVIN